MDWNQIFPPGEPVIALPNWDRPRLLLSGRSVARRFVDSGFFPAHTARGRAFRASLRWRTLVRRGETRVAGSANWALREFLGDLVDAPRTPAVQIGTPGAAQKWTLRITDSSGEIVAYVKWGCARAAIRRLHHEYKILQGLPAGLGPEPLKFGPLGGGMALCLSPIPGRPLAAHRRGHSWQLANFLTRVTIGEPLPIDRHPGFRELCIEAPLAITPWIEQLSDRVWPVAIQHGDLAPWNLFRIGPRILAVDWEYGRLAAPAFLDAAYYWLQVAALLHRSDPMQAVNFAVEKMTDNRWPALARGHAEALCALAAFDAWRQALEDGDSPEEPLQLWQYAIWHRRPAPARGKVSFAAAVPPIPAQLPVAEPEISSAPIA